MAENITHQCAECGAPIRFYPRLGGGAPVPGHVGGGQYLHFAQPVEIKS